VLWLAVQRRSRLRAVEAALVEPGHRLGGRVALGRLDRPRGRPHQPVDRRGGRVEVSEKNASPACRQVGPIRKNQSRPE
jgi:hypothetical protein